MAFDSKNDEVKVSAPIPQGEAKAAKKKPKAKQVLIGMTAASLVLGLAYYLFSMGHESTDDAQVEGRIVNVAARVPAQVKAVLVRDNQHVKVGEPLVQLDASELEARAAAAKAERDAAAAALRSAEAQLAITGKTVDANLKQAKGALRQATSGLTGSKAAVDQARADVQVALSRYKLAELDVERIGKLRADGIVSAAEFDAKQAAFDQAKATLEQARARQRNAETNIAGSSGGVIAAEGRLVSANTGDVQLDLAQAAVDAAKARLDQSEAALKLAELNLSYAAIISPIDGVVSRRTVENGQFVGLGTPLMAIVPMDDVWVVANFKEDQIRDFHAGQRARVKVDSYGGRDFEGKVDSVAAAAGSKFALLPADNASGNFVKVVQRIPVLIHLDKWDANAMPLRPGMSVEVTVYTGDKGGRASH